MTDYGPKTEEKIDEVITTCKAYGETSIVALAGVPGTGKSFIAGIAAQRLTEEPLLVREIQFHPSFSYEEFIEGFRAHPRGGFAPEKGIFLDLNDIAAADPSGRSYVLLIEEFTRANLPAILGELLTYVEYRDRPFFTIYTRRPVKVSRNLIILATYNPRDRSALELDEAIIRRMRIIRFPPSEDQLEEMLRRSLEHPAGSPNPPWIDLLKRLFATCRERHSDDFETLMPFGHGMFAGVKAEQPDLNRLWEQRIVHMIRRPLVQPHPFAQTIEENYPWQDPKFGAT